MEPSSELKVTRQNLSNDEKTGPVKQTLPMRNKGASNNRQRGWNGIGDQDMLKVPEIRNTHLRAYQYKPKTAYKNQER